MLGNQAGSATEPTHAGAWTAATPIDGQRLLRRLDELADVGSTGDGGCSRLALTDADRDGRDLVVGWMNELGLRVEVDVVGNITGTWPPDDHLPPVLCGSHIDTVATGGRFDGNLGVLAGLEVIAAAIDTGAELSRPLAVGVFTNEEGSRFAPDMLGSLVFVGDLPLHEALATVDRDGVVLGDELVRIGYAGPVTCPRLPPAAFLELHIEQGPVLERQGATIGAVTGVQGIAWHELTLIGQSNHAGTTPMAMRSDAGFVAAAIAVAARDLTRANHGPSVATVGRLDLHPDLVNVVPGRATLTLDVRDSDNRRLADAERALLSLSEELATAEGVALTTRCLARFEPVAFDPEMVDRVERIANHLGHRTLRLPSGAGHDAQMLARVCPTAMVFVPSKGGISHNPAENTSDADLVAGASVLYELAMELAS